jgi:hypothetical protein
MSEPWANRVVGSGSSRVYRLVIGQPSWLARVVVILIILCILALLAVIVIPVALIGVVLLIAGAIVGRTWAWVRRLKAPNGVLDERRNVRVIIRD